ncbi:MAG: chitobiase/beta-hexosaminidase C-terminal domain-containing protein, partial [Clostridia bacterium]|nr:chitobiase/beta-hexosaminidase C-terminal domain-containing protein [Clostridia bacterium]
MKRVLAMLLSLALIVGIMPSIVFAAEDSNVAKYFPLYGEYGFKDVLHEGEELNPPGDGNAIVGEEYLTLHRNSGAGNPDNTGHLVSNMPGEKITGEKISFAFNAKVDLNQSREVGTDEEKKRTIFLYGSSDYGKNCITLRYYYADNTSAVVLVQNGQDAVVATFPRPLADMWHNYAIALDGSSGGKLTVYVDGEEVAKVDSKGITADKIGSDVLRLNRATSSNTINVDSYYRDLRFIKGVITTKQVSKYYNDIKPLVWKELVNQTYVTDGMKTRTDITLPIGNGVKWESGDNTAINPSTGKVTRPEYGEGEKRVTLTMVYDGKKHSYNVTLLPIDAGDLILTSFDFDSVEAGSKLTNFGKATYTGSMAGYGQAANITGDFRIEVNAVNGGSLLSGLDSFTLSYDSKTNGANVKPFITVGDKIKIVDAGMLIAAGVDNTAISGVGSVDWKKVTVSVSATDVKIYVNGELVASQSGNFDTEAMLANSTLTIGAGGEGLIDNVKVYSHALTVDEINEYMAANVAPVMNANGGSEDYLIDLYEPITITHPAGDAFIYYTLDGTDPTKDSNKYQGAFHAGGVAHVKARAIASNGIKSEMVEA